MTDELIDEIRDRIVRAADPWLLVLFGSYARGTAGPDSDVDLLVVEDAPFGLERSRVDEYCRLRDALWGLRLAFDIVIVSHDEFDLWRHSHAHVIEVAMDEGQVLHARAA